jgi:hypothetical protein
MSVISNESHHVPHFSSTEQLCCPMPGWLSEHTVHVNTSNSPAMLCCCRHYRHRRRCCCCCCCSVNLRLAQDPSSEHLGTTVWDASIVLAKYFEKVCGLTRVILYDLSATTAAQLSHTLRSVQCTNHLSGRQEAAAAQAEDRCALLAEQAAHWHAAQAA